MLSSTLWLHRMRDGDTPFVFFPPAGSSGSSGQALADALAGNWSAWSVQYPARGPRLREPPATSIRAIAEACLASIAEDARQAVLFGHSFGAYVAYDVAQLLEEAGCPAAGLVVAGIPAPGTSLAGLSPDDLGKKSLVAALGRQGGTDPHLLADEELMDMILPALRADLTLSREYVDDHGRRMSTSVAGLGGRNDRVVTAEDLGSWQNVTDSWLGCEMADGDHFFYLQDPAPVAAIVNHHWPLAASA
jgi:pyochelin biosynthesis protein PchC